MGMTILSRFFHKRPPDGLLEFGDRGYGDDFISFFNNLPVFWWIYDAEILLVFEYNCLFSNGNFVSCVYCLNMRFISGVL